MSYTELHTGILKKIDTGNVPVEEFIQSLKFGSALSCYNNSKVSVTKEYVILNGELYMREDTDHKEDPEDVLDIQDKGNDTYSYVVRFYNGGTYLDEVLEEGLKELK